MCMLTNTEWKTKIGFIPAPAARAGATAWGIGVASEFKGEVTNPGIQALLGCQGEWGGPLVVSRKGYVRPFLPLGRKSSQDYPGLLGGVGRVRASSIRLPDKAARRVCPSSAANPEVALRLGVCPVLRYAKAGAPRGDGILQPAP